MIQLNRRNTETVEQALNDIFEMLYAQQILINQMNAGMSSLQARMNDLERQLIIQKVQLTGCGPSVRE